MTGEEKINVLKIPKKDLSSGFMQPLQFSESIPFLWMGLDTSSTARWSA